MANLEITPVNWNRYSVEHLDGVAGFSGEHYGQMVWNENLTVFGVHEAGSEELVGTILMRWEVDKDGHKEAVIVAAGGQSAGDITKETLPLLMVAAEMVNCHSMRVHTRRPGLVAKLAGIAKSRELVLSWGL